MYAVRRSMTGELTKGADRPWNQDAMTVFSIHDRAIHPRSVEVLLLPSLTRGRTLGGHYSP